jgi:hypothetical protein
MSFRDIGAILNKTFEEKSERSKEEQCKEKARCRAVVISFNSSVQTLF